MNGYVDCQKMLAVLSSANSCVIQKCEFYDKFDSICQT